jgi:alpha-glucosidase
VNTSTTHDQQPWRLDRTPRLVAVAGMVQPAARFRDPVRAALPDEPFPAYAAPLEDRGAAVGTGVAVRPRFRALGRLSVVEVAGLERCDFYGTGEQAGGLIRNGTRKTLWNNDHFDYTAKSRNLYQSHPFVLAVRADGRAVGVIFETTRRCDIDLRHGVRVEVHGPSPAVTVIERSSALEVVRTLHELTGRIPMPPLWALGYHQCRWSYEPESKVREIAAEFRRRRIPCDCLWLDIDYMDGFRCFTFDGVKFPDPKRLNRDLNRQGFRTIYMIDCGIKADPAYGTYRQGRDGGHFIKDASGREYHGEVWPGACAFPDFTREATRRWWAGLYKDFVATGLDGVWNDMNEPAVFGGVEKTMPVSNRHEADAALGGPDSHAKYHNLYGMQMVRATREGIARAKPKARPFVLTRSNFLGGQRYAATWTGDNRSDWNHLRWSISMALNMTLSGQPFVGPDIGGFIGEADGELFARWMGIGALLPFARAHSEKTTKPHEPWAFGEACERTCRLALERRYRLMPYLYTLFHEAARRGDPVVRPVFFADPSRAALRTVDDAFLLGPDLLVMCHVRPGKRTGEVASLLPGWAPVEVASATDDDLPRLFLRPGAALALGPARQWTSEPVDAPVLELVCHLQADRASCVLHSDAGDGHEHERGAMCTSLVEASAAGVRVSHEGDTRFAPTIGAWRQVR